MSCCSISSAGKIVVMTCSLVAGAVCSPLPMALECHPTRFGEITKAYTGFAHSLIQLMYGIEWEQPAIIAEGLAQAAIHGTYFGDFLIKVEKVAAVKPPSRILSGPELLERVQFDKKFVNSVRYEDPNKILDGLEILCPDEGIEYLAQVKVESEDLEEAAVENIHTAAYMASASVFHPPDSHRFDFFLM